MKKIFTTLTFLLIVFTAQAVTYTSTGNGNWNTAGSWTPSGPPASGSSSSDKNILIIQAGHTIRIPGNTITLSHVTLYVYGTLNMDNSGLNYANLNINGSGSGVIIEPGGRVIESAILNTFLNIRVNGTVVWNGNSDGDVTAGSDPIFLPAGIDHPLPVELIHWTVNTTSQGIESNWATASETNNLHFTLEASENGETFYEVARIPSHGNSTQHQGYSYLLPETNAQYLRLTQTDLDGTVSYFSILAVPRAKKQAEQTWTVYPNPATGKEFSIRTEGRGVNLVSLREAQSGKEVLLREFGGIEEIIKIELPETLLPGLYLVSIRHETGQETQPVFLQ